MPAGTVSNELVHEVDLFTTLGLFGLLAGGLKSLALWANLGAVCGGLYAYLSEHLLKKDEMARIGARLPASSSALLTFAETRIARQVASQAAP